MKPEVKTPVCVCRAFHWFKYASGSITFDGFNWMFGMALMTVHFFWKSYILRWRKILSVAFSWTLWTALCHLAFTTLCQRSLSWSLHKHGEGQQLQREGLACTKLHFIVVCCYIYVQNLIQYIAPLTVSFFKQNSKHFLSPASQLCRFLCNVIANWIFWGFCMRCSVWEVLT